MSLSDSQVRSLKATQKIQKQSCGDSLCLVVEAISKGGGKSFVGWSCFPLDGRVLWWMSVGVYGKRVGKWSVKEARDEWNLFRVWSKKHSTDPRDRNKTRQKLMVQPWEDLFGQQ